MALQRLYAGTGSSSRTSGTSFEKRIIAKAVLGRMKTTRARISQEALRADRRDGSSKLRDWHRALGPVLIPEAPQKQQQQQQVGMRIRPQ